MIINPAFLTMLEVYGCPGMAVKLPFFTWGYEWGRRGGGTRLLPGT